VAKKADRFGFPPSRVSDHEKCPEIAENREYHVRSSGVWWKDEKTVWMYNDGQKVAELTPGGPFKEPQYLFFDTEVFVWEGLPTIESLNDPSRNIMLVDWVRAWKLAKKGNAVEKNRATR
jgi:beta-glucanase (GH16 family)